VFRHDPFQLAVFEAGNQLTGVYQKSRLPATGCRPNLIKAPSYKQHFVARRAQLSVEQVRLSFCLSVRPKDAIAGSPTAAG